MAKRLHPGLMPLLDTKKVKLNPPQGGYALFMLMPLYREGSLWDLVHTRGRALSDEQILSVLSQVRISLLDTVLYR
jgi:hypothetical protein